jgi:hypothetical protein
VPAFLEISKADKALQAFLKAGGTLADASDVLSLPIAVDYGLMLAEQLARGATQAALEGFSAGLTAVGLPTELLLNDAALRQLVGAAQKMTEVDLLLLESRVVQANRDRVIGIYEEFINERELLGDPVRVLVIIDN